MVDLGFDSRFKAAKYYSSLRINRRGSYSKGGAAYECFLSSTRGTVIELGRADAVGGRLPMESHGRGAIFNGISHFISRAHDLY